MKDTYQTGIDGERRAEEWLCRFRGMKVLERRFKTKAGEVDLVMTEDDTIVFVEVKTRYRAEPGQGLLAVNAAKQRRIIHAAMLYLMRNHQLERSVRFDVVEVRPDEVIHIPNAFQQDGGMFFAEKSEWEGKDADFVG